MNQSHTVFVDAHVHIYDCFDLSVFLSSAQQNFITAASQAADEDNYSAVLFLTERSVENWFQWLVDAAVHEKELSTAGDGNWRLQYNEKDSSIKAINNQHPPLIIIPGRQVVTRESLEVLLLGTTKAYEDGVSISTLLEIVEEEDLISILPWGVGKWYGRRGEVIKDILENTTAKNLFIGDITGRPSLWPAPAQFEQAAKKGIRLLQGTDPLPIPAAAAMPGSYGFSLKMKLLAAMPARQIKKEILNQDTPTHEYGKRENTLIFVRNQLQLRMRKSKAP